MRRIAALVLPFMLLAFASPLWAAHPLITDDTGTQGTGKFQMEANGETVKDKEGNEEVTVMGLGVSLAAGLRDDLDVVIGVPYVSYEVEVDGTTVADEQGLSDVMIEAKWRFFEQGKMSLAVKPGLSLPTGDEDKGLGTGEVGAQLFLIGTTEAEPVTLHGNLGYIRNENNAGEEKNLWHLSVAAEYAVADATRLVGNIGMEKSPDPAAADDPAFALVGVVHSPKENIDVDAGVKIGLNDAEDDLALLVGMAVRF